MQQDNLVDALAKIVDRLEQIENTRANDDEMIDISDVAAMLRISRVSADRMKRCGELPKPIMLRGVQRWRRGEIRGWIRSGCVKASVWEKIRESYIEGG